MRTTNSANKERIEKFKEYERIYNENSESFFKLTLSEGEKLIGKIKIIPGTIFSDSGVDHDGFPRVFEVTQIKGNKNQQEKLEINFEIIKNFEIE